MIKIETFQPTIYPDFIERIWVLENVGEDVEIYSPPSQYPALIIPIQDSESRIKEPYLTGLSLSSSTTKYEKGTKLIGVRFYPYAISSFFQVNTKTIVNNSFKINIPLIKTIENLEDILEQLFQSIKSTLFEDLKSFYWEFRKGENLLTIEDYCKQHNTNYTSLNRLFIKEIGITPKKFERLIKFRKSFCKLIGEKSDLTSVSLNSGYFDQAHFIREFKLFIGQTPSAFQKKIKQREEQIINYNFRIL